MSDTTSTTIAADPQCCYDHDMKCGKCHDHVDPLDSLSSVIPTILLLLILTIVITVTVCWCYHRRRRRRSREMAIFTEKGELIVVKDDRKHTERQEPMVIKLSQLESRMVYEMLQCSLHSCLLNIIDDKYYLQLSENNNYSESNPAKYDSSQR